MRHAHVVPIVMGTLLLGVGCATKTFVREELQKSETKVEQQVARVEQQVGKVEADLTQEKARLTGVASDVTQVRSVSTEFTKKLDQATDMAGQASAKADEAAGKAGQATSRADEARGQADQATARADQATVRADQAAARADESAAKAGQALAKADETDNRLTRLWTARHKRTPLETFVVHFGFDKWELDDRAQTSLLDVIKLLQENPDLMVNVEGYTDSTGSVAYNVQLSQRRAEAVRRFLVDKGIELHRVQSIGLGDVRPMAENKTKQGRDQNRRVAIKLFGTH